MNEEIILQVFEDYPMCRFPVSIAATYYKPEPGTLAIGYVTRSVSYGSYIASLNYDRFRVHGCFRVDSLGFTLFRVDHVSVTCLIHGLVHATISLRKSVNFYDWCGVGQQLIFQIEGGEMHYKGVR